MTASQDYINLHKDQDITSCSCTTARTQSLISTLVFTLASPTYREQDYEQIDHPPEIESSVPLIT